MNFDKAFDSDQSSFIQQPDTDLNMKQLLGKHDPFPVQTIYDCSHSPFVLIGDHAGALIPKSLNELGLSQENRYRHIAWDIGVAGLGNCLSSYLHSCFIEQLYSRLVIDCNRGIDNPTSIPTISDHVSIQGNQQLTIQEKKQRIETIFNPYHQKIEQILEWRKKESLPTVLIALHSFTPEMENQIRPWHAGILHGKNSKFSLIFKRILERSYNYPIGDNEPYALVEANDYSVPYHAMQKGLPYLELEIRQDLLNSKDQQQEWAKRLAELLPLAYRDYQK